MKSCDVYPPESTAGLRLPAAHRLSHLADKPNTQIAAACGMEVAR